MSRSAIHPAPPQNTMKATSDTANPMPDLIIIGFDLVQAISELNLVVLQREAGVQTKRAKHIQRRPASRE